jgi:hypothetical protein
MAHSFLCLSRSMEFGRPESFAVPGAPPEHPIRRTSLIFTILTSQCDWALGRVKDVDRTLLSLNLRSFSERRQKGFWKLR